MDYFGTFHNFFLSGYLYVGLDLCCLSLIATLWIGKLSSFHIQQRGILKFPLNMDTAQRINRETNLR